jgi:hypothetical protein
VIWNDCWTCGAEFQSVSPAWSALIVQVPVAAKLITPALVVVHTPGVMLLFGVKRLGEC